MNGELMAAEMAAQPEVLARVTARSAAWPEPDPQIAAAIAAMYGAGKT